jgi:glutathione S-transferase
VEVYFVIFVHHLNNSRSQRILWLLEELGIPYEIKRYERDPKTMLAPPELRALHPLGKSPIVTDGPVVLAESGAILEYLLETYGNGRLRPTAGTAELLKYRYWLHYAEGSAMSPLLLSLIFKRLPEGPMPFFVKPLVRSISNKVMSAFVAPQIQLQFDFMESELRKTSWFAGNEFTAADIQMSFPVEAGATRGGLNENRPQLREFLHRIHQRPAYQRALQRGGPYEYAVPPEPSTKHSRL